MNKKAMSFLTGLIVTIVVLIGVIAWGIPKLSELGTSSNEFLKSEACNEQQNLETLKRYYAEKEFSLARDIITRTNKCFKEDLPESAQAGMAESFAFYASKVKDESLSHDQKAEFLREYQFLENIIGKEALNEQPFIVTALEKANS
jgi:hypothetical protein